VLPFVAVAAIVKWLIEQFNTRVRNKNNDTEEGE
jgi:hypothetical protein